MFGEYKDKFGDPYVAARNGWLDDVIEPNESRLRLVGSAKYSQVKENGVRQRSMGPPLIIYCSRF